jgi:hypothetical protein
MCPGLSFRSFCCSDDPAQLFGKPRSRDMLGDAFISLVDQCRPDIVHTHALALSSQLERSLYDVRVFRQFEIPVQLAVTVIGIRRR